MSHEEHCSCGCSHEHKCGHAHVSAAELTEAQRDFLHQLSHRHYLPVARFTLTDSREGDFVSTALAPVFIRRVSDDMAAVKKAGAFLQRLEDMGLLTLDYDIPLNGYEYDEYRECALYAYFRQTVAEAAGKPGFLGDTPVLELGSMALTDAGEKIAAAFCGHGEHCG